MTTELGSSPMLASDQSDGFGGATSDQSEVSSSTMPSGKSGEFRRESVAIAAAENTNVLRLRLLVIVVLVVSTVCVAFGVYRYIANGEKAEFESRFWDDSAKVLDAIGITMDLSLGSVDAFLVSMVSYAKNTGAEWPMVTYPDYAVKAAKLRSLSKAVQVTQYHIVTDEHRLAWENHTLYNHGWVEEAIQTQMSDETYEGLILTDYHVINEIFLTDSPNASYFGGPGPYLPKWQQSPVVPFYAPYNWDAMYLPSLAQTLPVAKNAEISITAVYNIPDPDDPNDLTDINNNYISAFVSGEEDHTEPFSDMIFPMLDYASEYVTIPKDVNPEDMGNLVGVFTMTFYWRDLIKNILPSDSAGMVVVFENSCNDTFTYKINGQEPEFVGVGDHHEGKYDGSLVRSTSLASLMTIGGKEYTGMPLSEDGCYYSIRVYPSTQMEDKFTSSDPWIFMLVAVAIFAFTSTVFICYDYHGLALLFKFHSHILTLYSFQVERRQAKVMETAVHSSAIVSSLFPSNVRDRLFNNNDNTSSKAKFEHNKTRLKSFLSDGKDPALSSLDMSTSNHQRPIADLFPDCTVLFSDLAGFTAWSSVREPSQVFTLLETLYGAFDSLASKLGVFKVETIGDAYVAVAGLPEPRRDHAVVMTKFARECLVRMMDVVRDLEKSLGPGTAELRMRVGLHSGAVTAGVLRSQKSRFQLFGDTVNTASRMESTGVPNKIQVSDSTAQLLIQAGKSAWVSPREETVEAKGKGTMQTYWIEPKSSSGTLGNSSHGSEEFQVQDEKTQRLVHWNTDILGRLLREILARRQSGAPESSLECAPLSNQSDHSKTVFEQVCERIEMAEFDPEWYIKWTDSDDVDLDEEVSQQLHDFVVSVAALYNENSFHCFDHASHVGMSTAKLLSRIVKPEEILTSNERPDNDEDIAYLLHQHTFGITSDPLAQFACVFSALIHDLDHPGVPNSTLVNEKSALAERYQDKSVAEQNSVDIAWNLFMSEAFEDLRHAICPTQAELSRFRQLVINIVMATDVLDRDLVKLRNERWEAAFAVDQGSATMKDQMNRKATIVMEHLIQASDVAHTMQHWHIYQKWNERLFKEMRAAYRAGRSSKDPAEFWYEGELSFMDNYVIPLAKKLRECGVFGVSSDEYLAYAVKNREEWERRGRDVVALMAAKNNQ
eukprot:Nitzschia sp. Nitz4//scaffold169_size48518//40260//43927//NITZ4_007080-RA/size48518-processed-gene-0.83-mRNA-1//1//CDS//3329538412//8094//frame0